MLSSRSRPILVMFLGAGFSRAFGMPLTDQLLRQIFASVDGAVQRELKAAICKFFPHAANSAEADFEVLLGLLDSLLDDKVARDRIFPRGDVSLVRSALLAGLGRVVHYSKDYSTYRTDLMMDSLIRILEACHQAYQLVIVTTNYDLIPDKAIGWLNDRALGYDDLDKPARDIRRFTYGSYIRGVWDSRPEGPALIEAYHHWQPFESGIQVYKLHGSLNWAYCSRCGEVDLSFGLTDLLAVYSLEPIRCAAGCGGTYTWLIVPPTHLKTYEYPLLKKTWLNAEAALTAAQRVVFIGYSLPPPDPLVALLILRARAAQSSEKFGYWVVNPDCRVHERFRTLLGRPEVMVPDEFNPESFLRQWTPTLIETVEPLKSLT